MRKMSTYTRNNTNDYIYIIQPNRKINDVYFILHFIKRARYQSAITNHKIYEAQPHSKIRARDIYRPREGKPWKLAPGGNATT